MVTGKQLKEHILHVKDMGKYMDREIAGCNLEVETGLMHCSDCVKKVGRE